MLNPLTFNPYFFPLFSFLCFSDVYEGTRIAKATDLPGIKKVIQPLEESGALVRRTDDEVCICLFFFILVYGVIT